MDANLLLWIGQILLALAFLIDCLHATPLGFDTSSARPGMTWLADVGRDRMRIIGGLEGLGAVGLIVPAATGILPWLTPLAAILSRDPDGRSPPSSIFGDTAKTRTSCST